MKPVVLQNPSDAVTFVMDDPIVAGVAVLLLGNGAYGLETEDGSSVVPVMLFGGIDRWCKEKGINLDAFIPQNYVPMAEFLDSVCYGSVRDRQECDEACLRMSPDEAAKYRAARNDRRRSSMNNIGKAALQLASQMRKQAKSKPPEK